MNKEQKEQALKYVISTDYYNLLQDNENIINKSKRSKL